MSYGSAAPRSRAKKSRAAPAMSQDLGMMECASASSAMSNSYGMVGCASAAPQIGAMQ